MSLTRIQKVVALLFTAFGVHNPEQAVIYSKILGEYDIKFVESRVNSLIRTWEPVFGQKIPSIAKVLESLNKRAVAQKDEQLDDKWKEFKTVCFKKHSDIPKWAIKIKEQLGGRALDFFTHEKLEYKKAEFIEKYEQMLLMSEHKKLLE